MKIIINNREFDYDTGCRLLKLKYSSPFEGLEDIWDDIVPLTFKEILQMKNVEDRRVGIDCLGLTRLHREVDAELVDSQTIKKTTTWVLEDGSLQTFTYEDTYSLYKIDGSKLSREEDSWNRIESQYYVVFKDTSTDRQYLLWVNKSSVAINNKPYPDYNNLEIDAIEAIAWTITTNIPKGQIEEIIRQGDCVLIKPKPGHNTLSSFRHLTKNEYLTLLTNES